MKALTNHEIFLVLISVSAAGSIQSMTDSSDDFGNRICAVPQPTAPPRALKNNVSYVNLETFRKHFTLMIDTGCLKAIGFDKECIEISN
jgi:hypothetical protein